MLEENRRPVLIGAAAVVIAIVLIGAFLLFRGGSEAKLTITSIPNDLTLTMDGQEIPANGEVKVKAGDHTLTGSRKGFQDYTQTFTAADGESLSVKVYLYANSATGREWAASHPEETAEAEAEAGRRFDELNRRLRAKYPVIAQLPYLGPGFKATYGNSKTDPKNPEAISVLISTYSPDGKKKALEWIQGQGWDPATLDIVWSTGS